MGEYVCVRVRTRMCLVTATYLQLSSNAAVTQTGVCQRQGDTASYLPCAFPFVSVSLSFNNNHPIMKALSLGVINSRAHTDPALLGPGDLRGERVPTLPSTEHMWKG